MWGLEFQLQGPPVSLKSPERTLRSEVKTLSVSKYYFGCLLPQQGPDYITITKDH